MISDSKCKVLKYLTTKAFFNQSLPGHSHVHIKISFLPSYNTHTHTNTKPKQLFFASRGLKFGEGKRKMLSISVKICTISFTLVIILVYS